MTKVQNVDSTTTVTSYHNIYRYEDSNHPTAPTQIGHDHYEYDANGNPIRANLESPVHLAIFGDGSKSGVKLFVTTDKNKQNYIPLKNE